MRIYVLSAYWEHEGDAVFGVTHVKSVADQWIGQKPPARADQAIVEVWDVSDDGQSTKVETLTGVSD